MADSFWEETYQSKAPWLRDQLFLASPPSAQLAVTSSLRSALSRQLCPNLSARDLKSLEIFKTSKMNSHRKRNWEGQTIGILADRNYIFFRKRTISFPVWLLTENAAGNISEIHAYTFFTLK